MTTDPAKPLKGADFVDLFNNLGFLFARKKKIHDFTLYKGGFDYVFESIDATGEKGYMTGQGKGIRRGDSIVLQHGSRTEQYQVEKIDYYAWPAYMWVALLRKSNQRNPS